MLKEGLNESEMVQEIRLIRFEWIRDETKDGDKSASVIRKRSVLHGSRTHKSWVLSEMVIKRKVRPGVTNFFFDDKF
jgi:hypothetical protein